MAMNTDWGHLMEDRINALEAENAKLRAEVESWKILAQRTNEGRDAALLQLSVIRNYVNEEGVSDTAKVIRVQGVFLKKVVPWTDEQKKALMDVTDAMTCTIDKRNPEPLYLCKNCGRHHFEGPKDCPV